jgi:hypothetical protein
MENVNAVNASAGGTFLVATGRPVMAGARLVAGSGAAATAVIRETDGSGRILCSLAAGQGTADESVAHVQYTGQVHVTIAGAGATLLLYQG